MGGPTDGVVSAGEGRQLQLIVTDGCAGLAAALQVVYPRMAHQRCGVPKLRNVLTMVRRQDHAAVKADAQAIYQAASRREAEALAQQFGRRWQATYPKVVPSLLRDLPELLAFFGCPRLFWRRLRTNQQHRTLLRGSPAADTPDGLFRQRPERRAEYLFDL